MIDSHCHFDLPAFEDKHERLLDECASQGITRLLVPGLTLEQFNTLKDLTTKFAHHPTSIDIALGCHPFFLQELSDNDYQAHVTELNSLAHQHASNIVAIGECGLDGSLHSSFDYQRKMLDAQIHLATDLKKPLVMHHRQSHNELIRLLKQHKFAFGGVIHAFSGSLQIAQTYIDMGFYLGVGGTITYERAKKTRETIAKLPLSHLLLETDAPDMPLFGYQGQDNSPTQLPLVALSLAMLKNIDVETVISITDKNYHSLFL
jgi:TatD DNase family protein